MTVTFVEKTDNTTVITVDFLDEGVDLQCETTVKGDSAAATAYLPFFEKDMRQNFADMFPAPEAEEGGMEI